MESFDRFLGNMTLLVRKWQDVHSSLGLPTVPGASEPEPGNGIVFGSHFSRSLADTGLCDAVYDRTGRYDVTCRWLATETRDMWPLLGKVPTALWKQVSNVVTSYITPQPMAGTGARPAFVSQMMLHCGDPPAFDPES
jgi:hypothetical protein